MEIKTGSSKTGLPSSKNTRHIDGNLSKSVFSEGVGHFERKFQTEGGVSHQPLFVSTN